MDVVALTAGDPYGVGPELIAKMWHERLLPTDVEFLFYMPMAVAQFYKLPEGLIRSPKQEFQFDAAKLGKLDAQAGLVSMEAFRLAVADALADRVAAVVTGPVNKQALALAGEKFLGHTELLQMMTNSSEVLMGFFSPKLNVFLNSIHIPLGDVSRHVRTEKFEAHLRLAMKGLRDYGISEPRLAVAGLNPHAGENGLMGREEQDILLPVIRKLQSEGLKISDPLSGDTVFYRTYHGEFDGVLAMYHDQGLAPLKLVAFDEAVNVTIGTSVIRTSVDHGTGFDIVGKNLAKPISFLEAIRVARKFIDAKTQ
jgi:4-hydroxythreonine-4-phosphate dehydrogenase